MTETIIAPNLCGGSAGDGGERAFRGRLMREAMHLLADEGMNGVSLRRIVRASGAANPSALHYHFRDRETLVREIARELQQWYEDRALPRIAALRERESFALPDLLEAVYGPVMEMLEDPALGIHAVRFIARLAWDFGHEGQQISADYHRTALTAMLDALRHLLPDADVHELEFKIIASMNNVYNGIAVRSYMWRSPFGASPLVQRENAHQLRALLLRYIEGGLVS